MIRRDFLCYGMLTILGVGISLSEAGNIVCPVSTDDSVRRWGKMDIKYAIHGRDGDLDKEVWDRQFNLAFKSWERVTPIKFTQVDTIDEHDIHITTGGYEDDSRFGSLGGILAWAQLPRGSKFNGTLITKFDIAEEWTLHKLLAVASHEVGHLLGLRHSANKRALMYPYIGNICEPQSEDIQRIQELYGKPF